MLKKLLKKYEEGLELKYKKKEEVSRDCEGSNNKIAEVYFLLKKDT